MLQIGIAGLGFMGMIHYLAYQKVRGARVAAICSRDKRKLAGDWRTIKGNFGPAGAVMDLDGIRTYEALDEMLDDENLDLIDICLPPPLHRITSLASLKANKHVFCEKPIALTARDANAMVRASITAKRQLFIGHVLPFFPQYAWILEAAADNRFGKLLGGRFHRCVFNPKWASNYFKPDSIGGPLIDLLVHDAHFIRILFGMPEAVFSRGRFREVSHEKVVEYLETEFLFKEKSLVVTAGGGVIRQPGRSFTQAFEIHFEKATCTYEFAVLEGKNHEAVPLTVFETNGSVKRPALEGDPVNAFVMEQQEVIHSINRHRSSPLISGQLATDALVLCNRQSRSVRTGRVVKV